MSNLQRVVVYRRVSTADKDQDPERQSSTGDGNVVALWIEANGAEVVGEATDHGTSGAVPPFQRQGFLEAVQMAKKNKADAILVESVDRFSREGVTGFYVSKAQLELNEGFKLIMADQPVGVPEFVLDILNSVSAAMAKMARDQLKRRIAEGLALAKKKGFPNGAPGPKPKTPITDQEVQWIAEWKAKMGWRRVAHRLSVERGAFEVADPKLQRRLRVSDAWVRLHLSKRAKSGCPVARSLVPRSNGQRGSVVDSAQGVDA